MKRILHITFVGDQNKQRVYNETRSTLIEFLSQEHERCIGVNGFIMVVCEMVKNILDHANGSGSLHIAIEKEVIFLEVADNGTEPHDFQALKKKIPKGNGDGINGVNYGLGLETIEEVSKTIEMDLAINTSSGFNYKGVWKLRERKVS